MKIPQRRAVSPIIATLLLIAIAVAAGVIVYVFTGSLAGSLTKNGGGQITQQVQQLAYNFNTPAGGKAFTLYIKNTGTGTLAINGVYIDGGLLANITTLSTYTSATNFPASSVFEVTSAVIPTLSSTQITLSVATGKSTYLPGDSGLLVITNTAAYAVGSHLVKIVTSAGADFSFNIVVGQSG